MLFALCQPGQDAGDIAERITGRFSGFGIASSKISLGGAQVWFDPARCSHSGTTLLHGWIDNIDALADELRVSRGSPADVYQAALAAWDDDADRRINGQYAALSLLTDGSWRLARSPWSAPPLNVFTGQGSIAIASLPSMFQALSHELEIDRDAVADQLAMDGRPTSYRGVERVRLGSVARLHDGRLTERLWYRVDTIPAAPDASDADRVAKCEQLLGEAAEAALKQAGNPAIALSGGLDSPIVAAELLAARPERRLTSLTFVPDPDWSGPDLPGTIGNEWPVVQRFAAMHPRLDAVMADPAAGGFDHRYREIAQIAGVFNAAQSLLAPHHAVWEAARQRGHDWLFTADLGNQSFSSDGRWAYAEWFAQGRWGQLLELIRARTDDDRPPWRQFFVLGLLPHLPHGWRARLQRWFGQGAGRVALTGTMLSPEALEEYRRRAAQRGSRPAWSGFAYARSRRDEAQRDWLDQLDETAEVTLALELTYGVRYRDVTAYRPLIEYCLSLPTRMFARNGKTRWLAQQLAAKRRPRAQFEGAPHGLHHVDWLVRLRRDAPRFLQQIDAMRSHPWLAETLDLDRMEQLLKQLPDSETDNSFDALPYVLGIARAIVAGQWVGFNEGRNDF